MLLNKYPRIIIGGLSGDSGKTIISCGLLKSFKERGFSISAFKKGPDYIDTAWLSFAAGMQARNLDTYLMGFPTVKKSFLKNALQKDISLIEGNRGLFDGVDASGTHSTAELAKLLQTPVIIIQTISKVTRTSAASILGCLKLDPDLNIAGVILNQVSGERHMKIAKEAIEEITGIPVLGAIPKLSSDVVLPSRHLGLITPDEFEFGKEIIDRLRIIIEENIDIPRIIEIAKKAPPLENICLSDEDKSNETIEKIKIGYFRDRSFSFYYPENLEMLSALGAELIPLSVSSNEKLNSLDSLYIGGGFPESNLEELISSKDTMVSLKKLVENDLPVYAECGGLIYLSRSIECKSGKYNLSGILPIKIRMHDRPEGHGYCEAIVDKSNPFFKIGTIIRGHEFHYSEIYDYENKLESSLSVTRGVGCFNKRDGLTYKNVFASYFHIHALASPEWADGMIERARIYQKTKMFRN